jgi:hypothetical protein
MSWPLSTSSATGKVPVCANSQSPLMSPAGSLWTADRNGTQGHVDPSPFKETGLGSDPCSALPSRKQPRRHADGSRCLLCPSRVESGRRDRGDTRDQLQEIATDKLHGLLRICDTVLALRAAAVLDGAGMPLGLDGTPHWLLG